MKNISSTAWKLKYSTYATTNASKLKLNLVTLQRHYENMIYLLLIYQLILSQSILSCFWVALNHYFEMSNHITAIQRGQTCKIYYIKRPKIGHVFHRTNMKYYWNHHNISIDRWYRCSMTVKLRIQYWLHPNHYPTSINTFELYLEYLLNKFDTLKWRNRFHEFNPCDTFRYPFELATYL